MHLVGFIMTIYHDARSPGRQIHIIFDKCVPKIVPFLDNVEKYGRAGQDTDDNIMRLLKKATCKRVAKARIDTHY